MSETDPPAGVPAALGKWLSQTTGAAGPFTLRVLTGGNSNETMLVECGPDRWVLRRPPHRSIAPGANNLAHEHRAIAALHAHGARVPRPLAFHDGDSGAAGGLGPMMLMEFVDGVSITDALPAGYPAPTVAADALGAELVDALAGIHRVGWLAAGLEGFGRPEQYLERQVDRLRKRYVDQKVRDVPRFDDLADWLASNVPHAQPPGVVHGDYHLDNTLFDRSSPRLRTVIDFELSTIGDPLVDLGLLLAFWGPDRPAEQAMPRIQAVTKVVGTTSRRDLAQRYAAASGRDVDALGWYMAMAFWKLAAIVEGAYAQVVRGEAESTYARDLEFDVPRLVAEAWDLRLGV